MVNLKAAHVIEAEFSTEDLRQFLNIPEGYGLATLTKAENATVFTARFLKISEVN